MKRWIKISNQVQNIAWINLEVAMKKKAYFITLEGSDGCGKSSVAKELKRLLEQQGFVVCHTREPGGIEIAEQIRQVILNPQHTNMDQKTEALLYAASRRQHLVEKILPALEKGEIVLCERFVDSSLAYQGYARGIGMEEVLEVNRFAIGKHFPDLTIFLDVDVETGLARIATREYKDRLDQEKLSFHLKVKEGYRLVNERFQSRIQIVDANQDLATVVENALTIILEKINGSR